MTRMVWLWMMVLAAACPEERSGPARSSPRDAAAAAAAADSGHADAQVVTGEGTTYFVRSNGGTADECDGLSDEPKAPGGHCAWSHPFIALPPGGAARIGGGDRLSIAPGSYRMGLGAPGSELCDASGPWDCTMLPPPSGPTPERPTVFAGREPCPELWGTERADEVLDLTGTRNVRIECLKITDHSGCVEFHSGGLACERDTPPYGDWAASGILATDSENVVLKGLDIHGLAAVGIRAGRIRDWTVEDVRLAANGLAGWDGDVEGDDGNSGTLRFVRWIVEWNGCGETWPGLEPTGCWAQTAGGYGDGVGTGETGGDWWITDSVFRHNTSDGLDLLYRRRGGTIFIGGVRAEGNAGNQIKTAGDTSITNSAIVGNCGFFTGKPFTHHVDACRAAGNAVAIEYRAGGAVNLTNDTIYSEGDCLLEATGTCDGTERLIARNVIFAGGPDHLQPGEQSCLYYSECAGLTFDEDYGVIFGVKESPCPVGANDLCADPLFADSRPESFDGHLRAGSAAIDTGHGASAPARDIEGTLRPAGRGVDRGAYEQ